MPNSIKAFDVPKSPEANGASMEMHWLKDVRSQEVQEIISARPGFWGTWALPFCLLILMLIMGGSWFIQYPDTIKTRAVLMATDAPRKVVLQKAGKVNRLFVKEGDMVSAGDPICGLQNDADPEAVILLSRLVDSAFILLKADEMGSASALFHKQLFNLGELQLSFRHFNLARQQVDNSLVGWPYKKGKVAFEPANDRVKEKFKEALLELKSRLDTFRSNYIITAPIDGKVAFFMPIKINQFLNMGHVLCFVNPVNSQYYATIHLSQESLSKVVTGQQVQLRLNAYPFEEFGFIEGKLDYISLEGTDSGFQGHVSLQEGLSTVYGKKIPFRSGLEAQAVIITREYRLLQRLYPNMVRK